MGVEADSVHLARSSGGGARFFNMPTYQVG